MRYVVGVTGEGDDTWVADTCREQESADCFLRFAYVFHCFSLIAATA